MRSTVLTATVALMTLSLSGCGNPSEPGAAGTVVPVQGVKVTPQVVQLWAIGETKQLVAAVTPANATDMAIIWESSDSTVASVPPGGLVAAKAAGTGVFVTAYTHDGHHQASVNVSVTP